jgi:hypothetical protein
MTGDGHAPDGAARELVMRARDALVAGDTARAQSALEAAARAWADAGDTAQQRWCARAAASVARHRARHQVAGLAAEDDGVLALAIEFATRGEDDGTATASVERLVCVRLLTAAEQLSHGEPDGAAHTLAEARALALEEHDVVGYLSVVTAQAQLAGARGDRAGAYRGLAVGWVTLGDAIGPEAAEHLVAPQLAHLRDTWGPAAFAQIKAEYEAQARERRAAGAAAAARPAGAARPDAHTGVQAGTDG